MNTNDTNRQKAHAMIDHIFKDLLPAQGMVERSEQIKLSHRMLDTMLNGGIALCDAGTGIGKTYAYLAAAAAASRFGAGLSHQPKLGLSMGLNNEVYAAMHILLPQTENIIRNLAKMCGDPITYLKEDGTEEFKPLSQLLNAENLRESYDENVLFTLETLLDERGGPNLRNENAHGILSPAKGSSGAALCFLSLLIRFLSLYSCESAEVLHKLLQR